MLEASQCTASQAACLCTREITNNHVTQHRKLSRLSQAYLVIEQPRTVVHFGGRATKQCRYQVRDFGPKK